MARRAKLRLLGNGWFAYNGSALPDGGIIEVTEEDAANFLRQRGGTRSVEFLCWVDDPDDAEEHAQT
jgi:hypothetical protein